MTLERFDGTLANRVYLSLHEAIVELRYPPNSPAASASGWPWRAPWCARSRRF